VALSLNDLKKGKAGKKPPTSSANLAFARRMVRPWEDPTHDQPPLRNETLGPESGEETEKATNRQQIGNKSETEKATNRQQIGNKSETIPRHYQPAKTEIDNKPAAQPATHSTTNRQQIGNKSTTQVSFSTLVGVQRQLVLLLYEFCKSARGKTTQALTLEYLSSFVKTSESCIKVSLQRLEAKGVVRRAAFKVGRGGWSRYELPDAVFQELLHDETGNKPTTKWQQTDNKLTAQPATQPATTPSSSSSSSLDLNKLTNTTNSEVFGRLPAGWGEIDISPLAAIRFGRHQLAQLVRVGTLSIDQVQESIHAFAFDLQVNEKGKEINGAALNYFMGILRKGPYAPPANYEPPEIRQMRLYLEAKEREEKALEELDLRLETVEFNSWVANLSAEERLKLVPSLDFAKPGSQGHTVQLKQYFREHLWPALKEKAWKAGILRMPERIEVGEKG
jgi:hypothetical protein